MDANHDTVQIKLEMAQGGQGASIMADGKTVWSGRTGQIATLQLDGPTNVLIQYQMGVFDNAGSCEGVIDPQKSKTWQVISRPGFVTLKLLLQPADAPDVH